ncbi:putative spindle pole body associated protein SnaD [Aspergillus clavatus NRRL 1]|uniref:Spindle pole body associated protein SnaD, putative n=1 Tax=Aspergillus clavatus (strain ATCC 1007 / CBS 513.65 / DSM 816 / NCTC 3887 / NRRL 1 / QM 1276 / 107) TaxID=344612 RepID=A1C4V2_ASPCL|nr:spindle pole body associated protein SnaD, putative [Aspergillus clavatus NRRL 1]EAW14720.1 spindle pole body associated protein SnaD, putative [Aspergillus clavatus NRRL 1]
MADTGYSSPDPTTHDTVGASTLATPLFMPSSPPSPKRSTSPKSPASDRADAQIDRALSPVSSRASSPDIAGNGLEARLAEYTVDFRAFPGGQDDTLPDLKLPHEGDKMSDVGGPEDFTANMERYLMEMEDDMEDQDFDEGPSMDPKQDDIPPLALEDQEKEETEQPQQGGQNADDEAELGEDSEFGPPVDMSTPSHFLRRTGAFSKEVTHLEDIEEDPDDEPETVATPSVRRHTVTSNQDTTETNEDLRRQVAELREMIRDRDEQLEMNHQRLLEAESAGEQVRRLQTELQTKSIQLDELHAKRNDEALLREQINLLQKQNEEKESYLRSSSVSESGLSALQRQLGDMQKELQSKSTPTIMDAERLETIAYLRQQLDLTQEQLRKRDVALEEALSKVREVTAAKELQCREKNTEIDGLKAQIDDHLLEIEKLETHLDEAHREYGILEEKVACLETRNRPLEEKNSTLEADLTRAQSQVTAQENALKAMAADLPLEAGGRNTYTEILELIKDLGQNDTSRTSTETVSKEGEPKHDEMEKLRQELARVQDELSEAISVRKTLEIELNRSQEQAIEVHSLIKSIEGENSRLTKRVDDLRINLEKAQSERDQLQVDHSDALRTIERLQTEQKTQQPSPPSSPPASRNPRQTEKLEETHQAQVKSLQTAHATAISTLRSAHADSTRKLRASLAAAEKREAALKVEVRSLRAAHASQEDRVQSLDAEVKGLQATVAAKDETAAAMDKRIARSVEKREKEWERRVDLLLKERERMSKALMWAWGQKEIGDVKENLDEEGRQVKQAYRYRYAQGKQGKAT